MHHAQGPHFLTAHLNPEETALKSLLQRQIWALITLKCTCQSSQSDKGLCSAPHVRWTQATEGTIKITDTQTLVPLTSSCGMMIWVSPWKSLKTRNRPCLIHEKQKEKHFFFKNSVVFCFLSQRAWQLATFCNLRPTSKHFRVRDVQTLFPHLNLTF